ncbi:MAG: plasmid recombination protein [Rhodobacterales bacterium]|nr:plasmid recombination protein [Rhodobacterales bacterium]
MGRFDMHDHRSGGDLSHVDLEASGLNEVLHCEPNWQETIKAEVAGAKRNNFRERMEALRKKGRKAERTALIVQGESDPWRRCSGGPLREGILTVNKEWFGGTGQAEWDAEKVAAFKKTAMDFLRKHFPDGQLRYANAHHDEEAFHIHFVAVVWAEKVTVNRGQQRVLQASVNPLLKNYEYAQDLAGKAFAPLGIARGERRAEARRVAKEAGEEVPKKRRHIPPSEWRADQQAAGREVAKEIVDAAHVEAKEMIDDGRTTGKAAIRKSRKRAVKEARRRNAAATREVAAAERHRKEEERAADAARKERADAETALVTIEEESAKGVEAAQVAKEKLQKVKVETGVEAGKLQEVKAETEEAEKQLDSVQAEVEGLSAKRDHVKDEVAAVTVELADVEAKVVTAEAKLSKAVSLIKRLVEGIDMLGGAVLRWVSAPETSEGKFGWGPNAPKPKEERRRIVERMRPVMPKLTPLAQSISRTIDCILAEEREEIAADAAYVLEQRENMEADQRAELTRILNENAPTDPTSDGPGT